MGGTLVNDMDLCFTTFKRAVYELVEKYRTAIDTVDTDNELMTTWCKLTRSHEMGGGGDSAGRTMMTESMYVIFKRRLRERLLNGAEHWIAMVDAADKFVEQLLSLEEIKLDTKQMKILYKIWSSGKRVEESMKNIETYVNEEILPLINGFDELVFQQLSRETTVDDKTKSTRKTYPVSSPPPPEIEDSSSSSSSSSSTDGEPDD